MATRKLISYLVEIRFEELGARVQGKIDDFCQRAGISKHQEVKSQGVHVLDRVADQIHNESFD